MIRDTRPLGFIPMGGQPGSASNPSGFGYAGDYWAVRNGVLHELVDRPYTRFQLNCPYGTAFGMPGIQDSFSGHPILAIDVLPFIRPAITDALHEAHQIRHGLQIDFHIGFWWDGIAFNATRGFDRTTDLKAFVGNLQRWRVAGCNGRVCLDASSPVTRWQDTDAIDATWMHGTVMEAIPLITGNHPDVARLARYPAWCRVEYVRNNMVAGATIPKGVHECVAVYNEGGPDGTTIAEMRDLRARGFVLGGDARYDAAIQEAMA